MRTSQGVAGTITLMPGTSSDPAFRRVDVDVKTGKVKGIRFSTLDSICRELECQPGDVLEHLPDYV